jgi:predicted transposase YdaD
MYLQDQRGMIEKAKKDGRAEGKAEGGYEKAIAIAQNLKNLGLGDEQIAAATGLGLAELAQLATPAPSQN